MHNRVVVRQRIHADRGETLLFCKKESLFYNVHQYVCLFVFTKRAKHLMTKDISSVSMYSSVYNVCLWITSRFSFSPAEF